MSAPFVEAQTDDRVLGEAAARRACRGDHAGEARPVSGQDVEHQFPRLVLPAYSGSGIGGMWDLGVGAGRCRRAVPASLERVMKSHAHSVILRSNAAPGIRRRRSRPPPTSRPSAARSIGSGSSGICLLPAYGLAVTRPSGRIGMHGVTGPHRPAGHHTGLVEPEVDGGCAASRNSLPKVPLPPHPGGVAGVRQRLLRS